MDEVLMKTLEDFTGDELVWWKGGRLQGEVPEYPQINTIGEEGKYVPAAVMQIDRIWWEYGDILLRNKDRSLTFFVLPEHIAKLNEVEHTAEVVREIVLWRLMG